MAEAVTAGDPAAPGVFSRKASGLVRVGNTLDVFIFNVGLVSVGIAIAYNQFYGPSLYPGAQPWISTLLAALGMIFVAAAFYCWSVVFPRSGGVYVFLSRTINPGVAFVMSRDRDDHPALLRGAGGRADRPGRPLVLLRRGRARSASNTMLTSWGATVAEPAGVFWIGSLIIVVAGALLASGTRRYFTVQRVLFVVAVAGLVVIAGRHAVRQPQRLLREPDQPHRAALRPGHRGRATKQGFVAAGTSFSESWKFISGRCCRCSARSSRSASAARSRRPGGRSYSACSARWSRPAW